VWLGSADNQELSVAGLKARLNLGEGWAGVDRHG
jgi:hypothetical protein